MPRISREVLALTTRPGRAQDFLEEGYFLRCWAEQMRLTLDAEPFKALLAARLIPTDTIDLQRAIVVTCSIVQWFGSDVGVCFLEEIETATKRGENRTAATLKLWEERNIACSSLNGGYTTLQHILNQGVCPDHVPPGDPRFISSVSDDDKRIAMTVLRWFAGTEGLAFRAKVESLIEDEKARNLRIHHERWNLGILAYVV